MTVYRVPKPRKRSKAARPLVRKSSPRKVNPTRKKANWLRAFGSEARVAFVKSLPCVGRYGCEGPIDNHHVKTGGAGRKADAQYIVPLCRGHHTFLHRRGRVEFHFKFLVDLYAAAAKTEAKWQAWLALQNGVNA